MASLAFLLLYALVCHPRGCERVNGDPKDIPKMCDLLHKNKDLGYISRALHVTPSHWTCHLSEPRKAQKQLRSSEWTDLYKITSEVIKFPKLLCQLEARMPCMLVLTFRKIC